MKLYFVRHGESVANLIGEFSNIDSVHPLTERGIEQAHILAGRLALHEEIQIYTSPILRAVQTAEILADNLRAPIHQVEALREWSVGVYEGTNDPAGWALHRKVQEDWFEHKQYRSKMPGGESFLDIQERFIPFIESLIQGNSHRQKNIILVAHGGLFQAVLPGILTNVEPSFVHQEGFPFTACIAAETGPEGLKCVSWNNRPFKLYTEVKAALGVDRTIDIVTKGVKSGLPRRTEIWFTNVDGRIIICGTPAAKGGKGPRTRRDWLANLKVHPYFTFCFKESLHATLSARAVVITDPGDRRQLMSAPETKWYRDQVNSVEDLVEGSPIIEVVFEASAYTQ